MNNAAHFDILTKKNFDVLTTSLSVLHNYFDSSTKYLFFWSVSAKILNISAKSFFFMYVFLNISSIKLLGKKQVFFVTIIIILIYTIIIIFISV